MAADQYLLSRCVKEDTVFVRFYTWIRPSITIGYSQKAHELLLPDKLTENNTVWIRRPTGGRAVLHQGDLTYSCIFARDTEFFGNSVKESYAAITKCLINGLDRVGIKCSTHDSYDEMAAVKRQVKLPCFLAPNRDEVMVNGRKLIGSAQKRTLCGVLQHGSLPITTDFATLPQYLNIEHEEQELQKKLLLKKCISLHEISSDINITQLIESLAFGFTNTLRLQSSFVSWNDSEYKTISNLASSQGFLDTWTI